MSFRYTISILTYTALEQSKACIASVIANSPDGEYELILTANGSESAARYFKSLEVPNVRVVENRTNEGFINPSIRVLEMAQGEFFVCLNDDARVPPGWLEALRLPFDSDNRMGLTGPMGGCCSLSPHIQGIPSDKVEYVEFACAMGRTSLLRSMGLFAPELTFAYWEDVDISLRMREAGFKLKLVPFRIAHQRAATSGRMPEIRRYQMDNGAYIRRRWAHYLKVRKFDYVTVIRRAAAHGDVLLITPIIRAFHDRNPNSPIWVETDCPEILNGNPRIAKIGRKLLVPNDAMIIDLNMAYENDPQTHIVAAYAKKAGLSDYSCRTEIYPMSSDADYLKDVMLDADWIAIHPGPTTWPGKNWDEDKWRELIGRLAGPVVLIGNIRTPAFPCTIDLRGKTTQSQLAVVLKRCRLLVTVDSLPLHVAQAVGTPVVGLFGVTSPEFIFTDGSPTVAVRSDVHNPSSGLRHRVKGATYVADVSACMKTITVEAVLAAVKEISIPV